MIHSRDGYRDCREAFRGKLWSIRKETKSERRMPRLSGGEEGRGKLRKGSGTCKQGLIRAYPNGETQQVEDLLLTQVRANPGN